MPCYASILALIFAVSFVHAGTPPSKAKQPAETGRFVRSNVVELNTDNFLEWTSARNRSIVLFYAHGLGNQAKAKHNFQRAAAIATVRQVNMEWAMVDCLQVASWICTRLGFTGFPPARVVTANETSWNKTEWTQSDHAVATLVAMAHYLSGDNYYQAHEEVVWGGAPNKIIHAVGKSLVATHNQSTTGTLVAMMSQKCGQSATFYGSRLIPVSNNEEFAGVQFVVNKCDHGTGSMYCTIHQTVNYPNVKFFRADENVNDPMHGTIANPEDLLDLQGFVRKCIAGDHTEL